jgi:uncharacterized protein CbrC (UPF0167 family)
MNESLLDKLSAGLARFAGRDTTFVQVAKNLCKDGTFEGHLFCCLSCGQHKIEVDLS